MKKTLKKITAMLLTALFMVNLSPTGASAAVKPTEQEIEPQDSGGFIYQYYTSLPAGWPEPIPDEDDWTGTRQDEMLFLAKKVKDYGVSELRDELIKYYPSLSATRRYVVKKMAEKIINEALSASADAMNISFSLTYLRNDGRRPYQYLYYYSYSYSFGQISGSGTQYELATLN